MSAPPDEVARIFDAAVELETPVQRAAYLDAACGTDQQLRAEVEQLLQHNDAVGSFLDTPAEPGLIATVDAPSGSERPGTLIGRYKLLEQIGEGGMGTVWMAQQTEPVKRLVAVKLIKPGMDSRQVVARFEAERQALALMDYPNIAKVHDAGETPPAYAGGSPRPFFVMELVKGVPVTRYCDEHRLTPRQRLELFVPVCQAIQHAHHKGIIHRDLKPSNVLVALYDDRPVPKVIDFGVAKATGPQLTEETLATAVGAIVGTLEYMSPEQAGLNQLDIDTRSDIYALGVLLYELLTGTTPLDRKRLKEVTILEVLRLIREEEPPRPSTRLSSTEEMPAIAANRGLEPKKLSGLVRGELDWIVMKCLEKDRNRRYETANGLARDVERYLADEPVLACPPSSWYRLRKFVRRNKRATWLAVILLVALGAVAGAIGWAVGDRGARQAALEQRVASALDEVETLCGLDRLAEAAMALKRAEELLASTPATAALALRLEQRQADLQTAARLEAIRLGMEADREEGFDLARTDADYRKLFRSCGLDMEVLDPAEAGERIKESVIRVQFVAALDDWVRAKRFHHLLGWERVLAAARRADPDPWRKRLRDALLREDSEVLEDLAGDKKLLEQPPATLLLLGTSLYPQKWQTAVKVLRQAQLRYQNDFWINLELARQVPGNRGPAGNNEAVGYYRAALALRPRNIAVMYYLARSLDESGNRVEAEAVFQEAIDLRPENPYLAAALYYHFGNTLRKQNKLPEAEAAYRKVTDLAKRDYAAWTNLGVVLKWQGKPAQAEAAYREALRIKPNHPTALRNLGLLLKEQGNFALAEEALRGAARHAPLAFQNHADLAALLRERGRLAEAEAACHEAVRVLPTHAAARHTLAAVLLQQGKLTEAEVQYRAAARLEPKNAGTHQVLGSICARSGQWHKAAADFERARALNPGNDANLYFLAAVRLHAGDLDGFRRARRDMLGLFGPADSLYAAERIIRVCLTLPDAVGAPERAVKLIDPVVRGARQHPQQRPFVLAKALADYRAGMLLSAVEGLKRFAPKPEGGSHDVTGFALLAMTQHRLGQVKEAREALANAQAILAKKMPDPAKGQPFGDDWHEWAHSRTLCREAEQLLTKELDGKKPE